MPALRRRVEHRRQRQLLRRSAAARAQQCPQGREALQPPRQLCRGVRAEVLHASNALCRVGCAIPALPQRVDHGDGLPDLICKRLPALALELQALDLQGVPHRLLYARHERVHCSLDRFPAAPGALVSTLVAVQVAPLLCLRAQALQVLVELCLQPEALLEGGTLRRAHLAQELLPQLSEERSQFLTQAARPRCRLIRASAGLGSCRGASRRLRPLATRTAGRVVLRSADAVLRHLAGRSAHLRRRVCALRELQRARSQPLQQPPQHARGLGARAEALLQDPQRFAGVAKLLLHCRAGLVDPRVGLPVAASAQELVELARLNRIDLAEHPHALDAEIPELVHLRAVQRTKQVHRGRIHVGQHVLVVLVYVLRLPYDIHDARRVTRRALEVPQQRGPVTAAARLPLGLPGSGRRQGLGLLPWTAQALRRRPGPPAVAPAAAAHHVWRAVARQGNPPRPRKRALSIKQAPVRHLHHRRKAIWSMLCWIQRLGRWAVHSSCWRLWRW
mmetsp:Transcript_131829/g.409826  ORF Transcript_131829/g.409826 Transcript_131829/m.409826 type:complete len:504 (+) Transcript_131829:307-1818(+)